MSYQTSNKAQNKSAKNMEFCIIEAIGWAIGLNKSDDEMWFRQLTQFFVLASHFVCVLNSVAVKRMRIKSVRFFRIEWVELLNEAEERMEYWQKSWNLILIMNWSAANVWIKKRFTCEEEGVRMNNALFWIYMWLLFKCSVIVSFD